MKFILSTQNDISKILEIIKDAQNYLAELSIDQWQDGYPDKTQVELDIKNNESYVILNDFNEIIGTTAYSINPEPSYNSIDGAWLTGEDTSYGVIHRLAVGEKYRKLGIAKFVFDECEHKIKINKVASLRIDTHRDNKGMQKLLKNRGFAYCGIILLDGGDERLAFEKIIIS